MAIKRGCLFLCLFRVNDKQFKLKQIMSNWWIFFFIQINLFANFGIPHWNFKQY